MHKTEMPPRPKMVVRLDWLDVTYDLPRRASIEENGKRCCLASTDTPSVFVPAAPASLDHFLVERYTTFTVRRGVTRRFDVIHDPWPIATINMRIEQSSLLSISGEWVIDAELVCAHFSPGVRDLQLSAPAKVGDTPPPPAPNR